MKTIEQIEKDWYDFLHANPHEIIDMLAALLAVNGIERVTDDAEVD
jgi:hypothetical protein